MEFAQDIIIADYKCSFSAIVLHTSETSSDWTKLFIYLKLDIMGHDCVSVCDRTLLFSFPSADL
jgi:hypothetical protein